MQISFTEKKNIRKSFGKLKESISIPNLIEVQKNSYDELTFFNPRPGVILLVTYDLPEPGPPARKNALKIPGS